MFFEIFETQNFQSNSELFGYGECWFGAGLAYLSIVVVVDKLSSSAIFW